MKKFAAVTILLLTGFLLPVHSEEISPDDSNGNQDSGYVAPQTILDTQNLRFSGYGGPAVRFGLLNNSLYLYTGGKGGAIINDSLVIGGGGYSLLIPGLATGNIGYGGFMAEYIFFPKKLINFSVGFLIGAGSSPNGVAFFVLEPEIDLFVNITKFFKLGISLEYTYAAGVNSAKPSDPGFGGLSAGLVFEFGKF